MKNADKFKDALDELLDPPIAYNPAFRRITGSTVAGLFLSRAWHWTKGHKDQDGWFYNTQIEIEQQTGLSRYEQETARKHCIRIGVLEEKLKGVPATLHYRVKKERVYELLGFQFGALPQSGDTHFVGLPQSGSAPDFNKESISLNSNSSSDEENIKLRTGLLARLYEENIGVITPLMASLIRNAAIDYPFDEEWLTKGFEIAVSKNVRKWTFVCAVFENWKIHGFDWKPQTERKGNDRHKKSSPKRTTPPAERQPTDEDRRNAEAALARKRRQQPPVS